MRRIFFLIAVVMLFSGFEVLADSYVPDFEGMQYLKCEISDTLYNADNSLVSKVNYYRYYHIDDVNKKVYLQKEPLDVMYFLDSNLRFKVRAMTDDFVVLSDVEINRLTGEFVSNSLITYDNLMYPQRHGLAKGNCKIIN